MAFLEGNEVVDGWNVWRARPDGDVAQITASVQDPWEYTQSDSEVGGWLAEFVGNPGWFQWFFFFIKDSLACRVMLNTERVLQNWS